MKEQESKSFWSSVPGILTGIAAVITAVVALIGVLHQAGIIGGDRLRQDDRQQEVQGPPPPVPAPEPAAGPNVPAGDSPAPGFRIVEVLYRADPVHYSGPCPVTITFSGRIFVEGGGGEVSYKWLRSDGAPAPVQTLHFDAPGSKEISTSWTLGAAKQSYDGWQAVETLDPHEENWGRAAFRIECT